MMACLTQLVCSALAVSAAVLVWQWRDAVDIEKFYRGKRVIVTGASKGIGRSLALQLAQLGAKVVIAARSEQQLAEVEEACLQWSGQVVSVVADVSREEDCRAIVDKARAEFGGLDILILNAALQPAAVWFTDYPDPAELFSQTFKTNVLQGVWLVKEALPLLNASRGSIVPVSSGGAGFLAVPKLSAYSASKHALQGFFKCLQQEFALTGTPVSITIMPLPFVLTDKAVEVWKPKSAGEGITAEACAAGMLGAIPLRRTWHFVDWQGSLLARFYQLCPTLFDWALRTAAPLVSDNF